MHYVITGKPWNLVMVGPGKSWKMALKRMYKPVLKLDDYLLSKCYSVDEVTSLPHSL